MQRFALVSSQSEAEPDEVFREKKTNASSYVFIFCKALNSGTVCLVFHIQVRRSHLSIQLAYWIFLNSSKTHDVQKF